MLSELPGPPAGKTEPEYEEYEGGRRETAGRGRHRSAPANDRAARRPGRGARPPLPRGTRRPGRPRHLHVPRPADGGGAHGPVHRTAAQGRRDRKEAHHGDQTRHRPLPVRLRLLRRRRPRGRQDAARPGLPRLRRGTRPGPPGRPPYATCPSAPSAVPPPSVSPPRSAPRCTTSGRHRAVITRFACFRCKRTRPTPPCARVRRTRRHGAFWLQFAAAPRSARRIAPVVRRYQPTLAALPQRPARDAISPGGAQKR